MYVFKKKCFKDNNKPAHWVGHSKLISPKIDEFFQRTIIFDENQASETGKTEKDKNADKKFK